jgi:uncharacterized metal-binding protein
MDCRKFCGDFDFQGGKNSFSIRIDSTSGRCPAGEKRGEENIRSGAIPVLSCEGACIRGEIARRAANIVAKEEGFARGCHGELLTVPDSAIARWIKDAGKVVVIDGCFLKCHMRIFKNVLDESKIVNFDALSYYNKYTEYFDPDSVPDEEISRVAAETAAKIILGLKNNTECAAAVCGKC